MSRLVLTAFGRPARTALEALVAEAKGDNPLAPVTVVVPSNYAALSLRRHDARFGADRGPGLVNVRFLALNRVAELLGAPFLAEPDRVPLTPEARLEAARVAVAEAPGVFAPVAAHPSTVRALAAAFHDLRAADDAALTRLAGTSPRAASVVGCYRRFRALTAATYDDEDQLEVAAALVAETGIPADLGALVLFCPDRLSPGGLALVAGFASRTFTAAVLGLTGDVEADAETRALADTLAPHLGSPLDSGPTAPRLGDRLISAPDPESEVREVVRALVERADAGGNLHDVAVVWRVAEPHARLLHERLGEAGIPVYGPSVRRLSDTVTGRSLLSAMDLVDRDFRRDEVMAFLAGAPIRESLGGTTAPVDRWDRISRDAGVIAGVDQWRSRLARHRAEVVARAGVPEPEWLEAAVDGIDRFQRFMDELVATTTATFDTWSAWCEWAAALVDRYVGVPPNAWPDAEISAHDRVLDRLAALGALPTTIPVDRQAFTAALAEQLEQSVDHVGRFGVGVLLCPLGALTGTDFDTVFVVGAAEGRLPPPPRDDPLLPDPERAVTAGQVPLRSVAAARERASYLAALAGASTQVVLTWARADPVGQRALLPSRWVVETARALTGTLVTARQLNDARPGQLPDVLVLDSFAAALRIPGPAISISELELRALDATRLEPRSAGSGPAAHPLTAANPRLERGFRASSARAEPRFTEYDGVVGPRPGLLPLPERPLSPSRIEAWAQCPFRYFLANVLWLRKRPAPEAIDTIDPRDRGSLVHKVLEDFIREMPPRTSPDQVWSPAERERARQLTIEQCDHAEASGQTGRPLLWQLERARILREVSRTLDADERIRAQRRVVTLGTEINFGSGPDDPLPALTLDLDGTPVTFRGQIDRIDASEEPGGLVVVYDYKTGSAAGYNGLDEDPVVQGTKVQLAIYALAAEQAFPGHPVRADYWHTAQPAGKELRGFEIDEARPRARKVLSTVAGGVAAGTFPAYSGKEVPFFNSFEECGFCDFDHLCSPDRERAFDAKRHDPAVAQFVELRGLEDDS
ncbi:MAG: PD-(D/E)XK nuclease family protein [Acidimicrobiia bacterium]